MATRGTLFCMFHTILQKSYVFVADQYFLFIITLAGPVSLKMNMFWLIIVYLSTVDNNHTLKLLQHKIVTKISSTRLFSHFFYFYNI